MIDRTAGGNPPLKWTSKLFGGAVTLFRVRNSLDTDSHIFQKWQVGVFIGFPFTLLCAIESREYLVGSQVPEHTDMFEPIYGATFTYVLEPAEQGGGFSCERLYIDRPRLKVYNATKYKHAVEPVTKGSRKVLLGGFQFAPWPVPATKAVADH